METERLSLVNIEHDGNVLNKVTTVLSKRKIEKTFLGDFDGPDGYRRIDEVGDKDPGILHADQILSDGQIRNLPKDKKETDQPELEFELQLKQAERIEEAMMINQGIIEKYSIDLSSFDIGKQILLHIVDKNIDLSDVNDFVLALKKVFESILPERLRPDTVTIRVREIISTQEKGNLALSIGEARTKARSEHCDEDRKDHPYRKVG